MLRGSSWPRGALALKNKLRTLLCLDLVERLDQGQVQRIILIKERATEMIRTLLCISSDGGTRCGPELFEVFWTSLDGSRLYCVIVRTLC
jgi:hypothetical protein